MTKKRSMPKPASLDEAFAQIEDIRNEYPVDAIEFLYNHPADERIVEKIVFHIKNYFNEDVLYDEASGEWSDAGLWYAIVAENHLDMRYVEPIAGLFEIDADEDAMYEQVSYLTGALCEKYGDEVVSIFISALEDYIKRNKKTPFLYLIDALCFADLDKYKNRILAFLKPDTYWVDSFVSTASILQIKEAIPIIKKLIAADEIKAEIGEDPLADSRLIEFKYALEELETGEKEFPDYPDTWYEQRKSRGDWKKHFNRYFGKAANSKPKKIGRNDPCYCGSGKKYKKCCIDS